MLNEEDHKPAAVETDSSDSNDSHYFHSPYSLSSSVTSSSSESVSEEEIEQEEVEEEEASPGTAVRMQCGGLLKLGPSQDYVTVSTAINFGSQSGSEERRRASYGTELYIRSVVGRARAHVCHVERVPYAVSLATLMRLGCRLAVGFIHVAVRRRTRAELT